MTSAMGSSPLEQGDGPRVGVSGSSLGLGMKLSQFPLSLAKSCYLGGPGLSRWKQWPLSFPSFRWGSETYWDSGIQPGPQSPDMPASGSVVDRDKGLRPEGTKLSHR